MGNYRTALEGLNQAQRQAVTTIEGPVLVIAGPGTGKTQLLSTRIAHILSTTDTLPENILCLTFTDSAAHNMRQRLSNMIGQAAYKVTMSTYHAFGSDLIRRFPDYFSADGDLQPIDDLGIDTTFRGIIAELPYSSPLKFADTYLRDIKSFVSDAKRALLSPDDIRAVADANAQFIAQAQPLVQESLQGLIRIDKKALGMFENLHDVLDELASSEHIRKTQGTIVPLSKLLLDELQQAIDESKESGKTTALTRWKNAWLAKDAQGQFVLDGAQVAHKLHAGADIYEQYLHILAEKRLFDYDDMILRAVRGLQENDELRYTVQEQYLYILLDEFQDTNGAQLRIVELLSDNPVHEGRPNVLAVGDDDQAIYAFQGADYSHMLQFQRMYQDVMLVPLTQNYRSHADVLHVARGIAEQIEERLHHHFPQIEKTLVASNPNLPPSATIERREAKSDIAQFAWTATKIRELLDKGTPADDIAVLAPQHKYLEPLVPFLQEAGIPVRYDKRENVLDDPAIEQLVAMSRLCLSLATQETAQSNAWWCEVLSYPFWQLPTSLIWQLSWQASDDNQNWTETLLQHDELRPIALFFIRLSMVVGSETLETVIDYLVGVVPLDLQEPDHAHYRSPFYGHYFSQQAPELAGASDSQTSLDFGDLAAHTGTFWDLLTNLTVLRSRLRDYRTEDDQPLQLADFIAFVDAHRAADIKILNTSPYQDADASVQLMTAFKAKGMEFGTVFVLAANDEAWGTKTRSQSSRLSLPPNLQFMRYAGATSDERLRLFYVALTRAKLALYILNYTASYSGKSMSRLQYLSETTEGDAVYSPLLPKQSQIVLRAEAPEQPSPTTELATYWHHRHQTSLNKEDARALLRNRLEKFQLSPTHVNAFIDLEHAGPGAFFMNTLLRFPKAPVATGQFGNAIHETMEWIHVQHKKSMSIPELADILSTFEARLRAKRLSKQDTQLMLDRGLIALRAYLNQREHTISASDESEFNFRHEGVFVGAAHMTGKIDKLIINKKERTITIVDFKTGKSFSRWTSDIKLHKYRQQLYLYKALVEGSSKFKGYTVTDAYLEFVEPDESGTIQELHLVFNSQEYEHIRALAVAVWDCIMAIDLPDIGNYPATLKGVEAFELDLLSRSK
jgi:DNA helicase-2/ATP-dependent DNA helicase PcrA